MKTYAVPKLFLSGIEKDSLMHVALLKVAIELLHRDPELQQQETRTAVNKFFSDRFNIDGLRRLIENVRPQLSDEFAREARKLIKEMTRTETLLRRQILELECDLRIAKQKLAYCEFDPEKYGLNNEKSSKRSPGEKKKVRVWSGGIEAESK